MAKKKFLIPKRKPNLRWEILSYDKETRILQARDGPTQFGVHIDDAKDRCVIVELEVEDAEQPELRS